MQNGPRFASRRAALGAMAAIAVDAVTGCSSPLFSKDPVPVCPSSPSVSAQSAPLTIDAHAHVFNGTDIQIYDFLTKVYITGSGIGAGLGDALSELLQLLAWATAPDGNDEMAMLQKIQTSLHSCDQATQQAQISAARQERYAIGRAQLQSALRRAHSFQPMLAKYQTRDLQVPIDSTSKIRLNIVQEILSLPPDVESFKKGTYRQNMKLFSIDGHPLDGLWNFVMQNFQYRYVSINDYLDTYNQPGTRVIDLLMPSMVDFDWWLAAGKPTQTSLSDQVSVMEKISILTGGRVHGFVPFDPLREVAYSMGLAPADSISLVKAAVEQHGFIGVKLYPPMGFAPYGNTAVQKAYGTSFWHRDWLPPWVGDPSTNIGQRLDVALDELYTWCIKEDVPVMAHTAASNGVVQDFENLTSSQYFGAALNAYPALRINFGHFGDTLIVNNQGQNAQSFIALMQAGAGQSGQNAYADAAYFMEIVANEPGVEQTLLNLFDSTATKGSAALANRLVYGTDWEMTLVEGSVGNYLSDFEQLCTNIEQRDATQQNGLTGIDARFFGINAVNYIGLRKGNAARRRLDAFYSANNVATPDWLEKVDALSQS